MMQTTARTFALLVAAFAEAAMCPAPGGGQDVPPPPPPDVIGFCAVSGTLDDPGPAFAPGDHRAGRCRSRCVRSRSPAR